MSQLAYFLLMKLRHHPLMTHSGAPNWPPVWSPAYPREDKHTPIGEIGVLEYILFRAADNRCFLVIKHDGMAYVGPLLFDDEVFCQKLAKILENYSGHTIKEIGDLDLTHLL